MWKTLLNSGATIHQTGELEKKLEPGTPLRIKYGIDPTAAHVHLGHAVGLLKLRQLQKMGHTPVLIIGDYTARIGDPTGRDETRPKLKPQDVDKNALEYLKQIAKIIDIKASEVRYNSSWFGDMTFMEVIEMVSKTTISQILERKDFAKRLDAGNPIFMHECIYPMMQAYDSVVVQADVEIGGTEQLFNLMLARDFQREANQEPQVCLTVPILRGLDGERRMGKSLNNYIGLAEPAEEMYAKVMSIPDSLMEEWWTLLPLDDVPFKEAVGLMTSEKGLDNMGLKKMLAARIVHFFNGESYAAAQAWTKRFSQRQDPDDIPTVFFHKTSNEENVWICKLLVALELCKSNNEARRLIAPQFPKLGNSGVTIGPDRQKIEDPTETVQVTDGLIVRVGSRRVVKVRLFDDN